MAKINYTGGNISNMTPAVIISQQSKVYTLLENFRDRIEKSLPRGISVDRMISVAVNTMTKSPELLFCTEHSIISAICSAGSLGLVPDPVLGECYLSAYIDPTKGIRECQFIIGYRGLVALAMRSGQVKSVEARPVYEGDKFDYGYGLNERLDHVPKGLKDPEKVTDFYALLKYVNGGHIFEVATVRDMQDYRDTIPSYMAATDKTKTYWGSHFPQMGRKQTLRNLLNLAPLSPELTLAIGLDRAAETGRQSLSVSMLQDNDVPDGMKNDIAAELQTKDAEIKQEKENEKKAGKPDKVAAATENLNNILNKKK